MTGTELILVTCVQVVWGSWADIHIAFRAHEVHGLVVYGYVDVYVCVCVYIYISLSLSLSLSLCLYTLFRRMLLLDGRIRSRLRTPGVVHNSRSGLCQQKAGR